MKEVDASGDPQWHAMPRDEVVRHWDTDGDAGLAPKAVAERRAQHGTNALPRATRESTLRRVVRQLLDPLVAALLVAAVIAAAVAVGESDGRPWLMRYGDTIAILLIVVLNAILGLVQERRAERALESLEKLASPFARVVRGGRAEDVPASELVPGDVVELEPGDAVPADVRLIETKDTRADESTLTGESIAVEKHAEKVVEAQKPVSERCNMAWMGTSLVRGRARAVVVQTGARTELGKIGAMITAAGRGRTPLEQRLARFGKIILIACVAISAFLFFVGLIRAEHDWAFLLLTSVSLAVAAIPEGLPAITTITLALGTQRMAKRGAIVRKLPAVETLGSATVICSDKTGTLTQNTMTVRLVETADATYDVTGQGYTPTGAILRDGEPLSSIDEPLRRLLVSAALCNAARLQQDDEGVWRVLGDPTEGALLALAPKGGVVRDEILDGRQIEREIPFDSERRRMTVLVRDRSGTSDAFVKGSPEVILPLATRVRSERGVRSLSEGERERWLRRSEELAGRALRVLAIAERPDADDEPERDLVLLGFAAMMDPPREEAHDAVAACQAAGIRVVMITGDHRRTAIAIARELGIWRDGAVAMEGEELESLGDEALAVRIEDVAVFARVTPEQKLRIVRALKRRGHIVAMTGDGVNDAPALREAQIGVAMGQGGTDVAREAAAMVLADDRFETLVHAVREGRAIFRNIQKFIFFLASSNTGLTLAVIALFFVGDVPPLTPLQLLWINLVTNGLPALALGIEPPAREQMNEPPRAPSSPILAPAHYAGTVLVGLVMAASALAFYWLADQGSPIFASADRQGRLEEARSLAFTLLAISPLFHAFNCRSLRTSVTQIGLFTNPFLWAAVLGSASVHAIALLVRPLQPVFHTHSVTAGQWALLLALAALPIPAMELFKLFRRGLRPRAPARAVPAKS